MGSEMCIRDRSIENADSQAKEKSAMQMFDKNADSQAKEKSAKQLSVENADLITIKYRIMKYWWNK